MYGEEQGRRSGGTKALIASLGSWRCRSGLSTASLISEGASPPAETISPPRPRPGPASRRTDSQTERPVRGVIGPGCLPGSRVSGFGSRGSQALEARWKGGGSLGGDVQASGLGSASSQVILLQVTQPLVGHSRCQALWARGCIWGRRYERNGQRPHSLTARWASARQWARTPVAQSTAGVDLGF